MRPEIKKWWSQAKEDLDTARVNLDNGKYYASVFFCQQTIEKGLKTLVLLKTKNPNAPEMVSHSLIYLGKSVNIPHEYHALLRELTPQYTLTRYPDASEETPSELYDQKIAAEFFKKTKEVLKWIEKQLK